MKIKDMLSTGVGVLLVSNVEVLVDNIESNCSVAFDYGFLTQEKRRHVSNSDLSRQHVWSNGSDML